MQRLNKSVCIGKVKKLKLREEEVKQEKHQGCHLRGNLASFIRSRLVRRRQNLKLSQKGEAKQAPLLFRQQKSEDVQEPNLSFILHKDRYVLRVKNV